MPTKPTDPQMNCRFFSGYKPCERHTICSSTCPEKMTATPRILIIHLEALGAVLRATVVLRAVKRKWPQAHITWITNPSAAPLLQNNPLIDRLLKNDHNGTLALSTLSFDYTFCVDKSLTASGLMNFPRKIGVQRGFGVDEKTGAIVPLNAAAQRLYELGLSNHEKFFVNQSYETKLMIESLELDFKNDEYVFELTPNEISFREEERSRLGLKGLVIGLNTGCSNTLPHKKLSVEGWTELIDLLMERYPLATFLLLGGPEDTERNTFLAQIFKSPRLINTPTQTGLRNGFIYVDLCHAVVTGDSLGMHMSIALKKWTVCWFGPSVLQEIDFYGRGVGIKTDASCSPCWKRECSKPVMCYDLVNFQKIVEALDLGLRIGHQSSPHFGLSHKGIDL